MAAIEKRDLPRPIPPMALYSWVDRAGEIAGKVKKTKIVGAKGREEKQGVLLWCGW